LEGVRFIPISLEITAIIADGAKKDRPAFSGAKNLENNRNHNKLYGVVQLLKMLFLEYY
jgi:hypothetical protein